MNSSGSTVPSLREITVGDDTQAQWVSGRADTFGQVGSINGGIHMGARLRLAVLAITICVVASGCGLDDAPEESSAIERIAGVSTVDLEGGYESSEWVHVTLDGGLSSEDVRRVARDIGSILEVQNRRWGVAELELTRPDNDGKDVYSGTARDLGSDALSPAPDFEGWVSLALCPQITATFADTFSHGDPTPLEGPTEAVAGCLGTLTASAEVREGIERREVALVMEGLTMRWDPALTPALWRAASAAWRQRDPAVMAFDVDLNTYPGGQVQVSGAITFKDPAIEGWTPANHGDLMGAAIDPLILSVADVTMKHHWTLKADRGDLLVFGEVAKPDGHADTTEKPGDADWNAWFDSHLAQMAVGPDV